MGRHLNNEGTISIFKNEKYQYWRAGITIMRKRYTKTFPYDDYGYKMAEAWLKLQLKV